MAGTIIGIIAVLGLLGVWLWFCWRFPGTALIIMILDALFSS